MRLFNFPPAVVAEIADDRSHHPSTNQQSPTADGGSLADRPRCSPSRGHPPEHRLPGQRPAVPRRQPGRRPRCRPGTPVRRPDLRPHPHAPTLEAHFRDHPPRTTADAQATIERLTGVRRRLTQVRKFLKKVGPRVLIAKPGACPRRPTPSPRSSFWTPISVPDWPRRRPVAGWSCSPTPPTSSAGPSSATCGAWSAGSSRPDAVQRPRSHRRRHPRVGPVDERQGGGSGDRRPPAPPNPRTLPDRVDYRRLGQRSLTTHGCADLAAFYRIELLYLPPYSPNLNLIERVWNFIKADALANRWRADFADFRAAIDATLDQLHTTHRDAM